jgi:hypothetical protein
MRRLRRRHLIVVAAAALFSSSWFYDGWLLVRDGFYSSMWLPNLLLSPFLYLAAGLLWNLEVGQDGEVSFALLRNDWPRRPGHKQVGISLVLMTLPFVGIASFILLFSVHWKL